MKITIARESLISRKKSVLLTFLSLLISISVLLSVEHLRVQAKESFNRTVSGVDLIVGAPSGQLNLLLYSVFRMGSPTNSIKFDSYQAIKANKQVDWVVPFSLGDSHRGFRVLGTSSDYFEHFKYGNKQALEFSEGESFSTLFEAVLGYDVAQKLNYKLGDKIIIAHGIGEISFTNHDQAPFVVTGILAPTGTPVDKTVHVNLSSIEAIHLSPNQLRSLVANQQNLDEVNKKLHPDKLSALMVGLKSRMAVFALQRQVNDYPNDRLMAILPGVALAELWQIMGNVEKLMLAISGLILISSLFGLAVMLLASMRERRREIAVLRVVGARPGFIFSLVVVEALLLTLFAIVASVILVSAIFFFSKGWLAAQYGLFLEGSIFTLDVLIICVIVLVAAFLTALLPAIDAYRNALHTNLMNSS